MSAAKLLLCLIAIFLVWRFLTLDFVEEGGDAVWKWSFLRYYAATGKWYPLVPDHHQGRWGVNLPVLVLLKLFGDSPWLYYLFPLLFALGTGILLFLLTARLRSKAAGTAAFLLFLLFPLTVRNSTQFLPMLPAAFFILSATWLLFRHMKTRTMPPVFFGSILIGIAYGCKFTSLYWAVAFLFALLLWPSEKKEWFHLWKFHFGPAVVWFSLGLLLVLVCETLLFHRFFGTTFGRAEVIFGSHLHDRPLPQYKTLLEYLFSFVRPLNLQARYYNCLPQLLLFLASLPLAFLWCRKGSREQRFVAFSFLTVYFLHCYVVYKVFPFLHPELPNDRYFLALAVVGMIVISGCWNEAGEWLKKYFAHRLIFLFQFLFVGALLLPMLIRAEKQFSHCDWFPDVLRINRCFASAKAERRLVLSRIKEEKRFFAGDIDGTDFKFGNLWTAVFGPVSELPKYGKVFLPVRDRSGRLWIILHGGHRPADGVPTRVLLLDRYDYYGPRTVTLINLPPVWKKK